MNISKARMIKNMATILMDEEGNTYNVVLSIQDGKLKALWDMDIVTLPLNDIDFIQLKK